MLDRTQPTLPAQEERVLVQAGLHELCINTIRFLSADGVQQAEMRSVALRAACRR